MLTLDAILAFLTASAALSLAPGPDNLFVLTQSALYGPRCGILVILGLCTGLIVHTSAVALGVAAIFQTSTLAFTVLKLVGAGYLLYLAWGAFSAPASAVEGKDAGLLRAWPLYRRGIIMNITNPKVSIFFLAFLPQFADPERGSLVAQIFILGGLFIGVALVIFCGVAVLAGTLGRWLQRSPRVQVSLNRLAALVFVGLALKLLMARGG